ncbi:unnamed protein product, partial [Nesidiocoris tenuis]
MTSSPYLARPSIGRSSPTIVDNPTVIHVTTYGFRGSRTASLMIPDINRGCLRRTTVTSQHEF